ncbi:MAG: hypothetical protein QXI12_04365 [Candidatus Methanomethyliaceae archaeon]
MPRRRSPLLFASVAVIALALIFAGAYFLSEPIQHGGFNLGDLLGLNKGVQTALAIDIVSSNGSTVEQLAPKNPLAIIAQFGQTSTDITKYMSAETAPGGNIYYFKLTPSVKPTFSVSSGTPSLKVEVTWSPVTVKGQNYPEVYKGTRLTKWEGPIALPYSTSATINSPTSGQAYAIGDNDKVILICITESLPTPEPGQSYTITGKVTVKSTLLVNDTPQGSPITSEATYSITIKNQPDGVLSAVDVSVTINTVGGW